MPVVLLRFQPILLRIRNSWWNRAFHFQRQISEAQTKLNTLMDRPAHAPLGLPAVQTFAPVALTLEKVEGLALVNRPELLMAEKKIEAAQARLDAAHKEWIPEPSF